MTMKSKFSEMVENTVAEKKIPYMEAVIDVCEDNNIEVEDVKKLLSNTIKSKIEAEARALNFLPRGSTLPID